ncbi:MAG: hypothetical protein ACTSU8_01985 [Alphaproteobacteria bacterium]
METSSRLGLFIFLGLIIGAIIGRWGFGYPVYGAIIGAVIFIGLALFLDKRANT